MRRLVLLLLISIGSFAIAYADSGISNWQAEYYDNQYLIGTPVVTSTSAVSFVWGSGAPASGISADNFSARFTTRTDFVGGTYRFFARADDEVRVTVNSQTLIDTFDRSQIGATISSDIVLASGSHEIQVDYRERTGDAYVFVTWENAASDPTNPTFNPVTTTVETPVSLGPWIVQYFGNENLSGLPTAILSSTTITQNWGQGSPIVSVPADNFSARWTGAPTLAAGRYRFTVRADDGVRVLVDGQTVINRWEGSAGDIATGEITLASGQHNVVVEYREATVNAYIEFEVALLEETQLQPTAIPAVKVPSNPPVDTNATGTVDAYRLNIRAAPTTSADIVIKIERGETYPIIGRNADDSWWQLDVNGTVGWAYADFIVSVNTANVPVTSTSTESTQVQTTGLQLTATGSVRLRSRPTSRSAILGLLPFRATADIVGRNANSTWVQVEYNGTVGWVSASFIELPVSIDQLPIAPE